MFGGDFLMKKALKFLKFMMLLGLMNLQSVEVEAHREESACQLANTCQTLLSERVGNVVYWSENKENELRSFIQDWQYRMGQSYVEYDSIEIDNRNIFENISVEGQPANIVHYNNGSHTNWKLANSADYTTYIIYAIYKSEDPHLYLFGYEDQYFYPVVLYTDLQSYSQGMIEFWPTQNQELTNKFLDILIFGDWS